MKKKVFIHDELISRIADELRKEKFQQSTSKFRLIELIDELMK
jgi:hypothetical protein